MMFRDEADILLKSLNHWRALGIENFYLCDNASADESKKIALDFLKTYADCAELFDQPAGPWVGRAVYNHLKDRALSDGCNWLFPADADEFLQLPTGCATVQDWLSNYTSTPAWGELPYINIHPSGREVWQEPQRKAFGFFFFSANMTISVGNHVIENMPPTLNPLGAYYRHYSVRSYEQFKRKMVNWMTAFQGTPFGDHPHVENYRRWKTEGDRYLLALYEELNQSPNEPAPKWL